MLISEAPQTGNYCRICPSIPVPHSFVALISHHVFADLKLLCSQMGNSLWCTVFSFPWNINFMLVIRFLAVPPAHTQHISSGLTYTGMRHALLKYSWVSRTISFAKQLHLNVFTLCAAEAECSCKHSLDHKFGQRRTSWVLTCLLSRAISSPVFHIIFQLRKGKIVL